MLRLLLDRDVISMLMVRLPRRCPAGEASPPPPPPPSPHSGGRRARADAPDPFIGADTRWTAARKCSALAGRPPTPPPAQCHAPPQRPETDTLGLPRRSSRS